MKNSNAGWALLSVIVGVSLTACSGAEAASEPAQASASAAELEGRHAGFHHHMDPAELFKRLDKNNDGTVLVTELEPRAQKWLAPADTDHDGKLSLDELKAHKKARGERRFEHADTNNNGSLEASEVGEKKWAFLRAADADGSGAVTKAEIEQARASGKLRPPSFAEMDKNADGSLDEKEVGEQAWAHMKKADVNGNGLLTKEELEKAREHFQKEHFHK